MWYQGVPNSEMGCKSILLMPGGIVGEVTLGRKGNYSERIFNVYRVVCYKSSSCCCYAYQYSGSMTCISVGVPKVQIWMESNKFTITLCGLKFNSHLQKDHNINSETWHVPQMQSEIISNLKLILQKHNNNNNEKRNKIPIR